MQSFCEFLKYARKKKGITQEEMANKLHIVSPVVSKWENGKGVPDLPTLCKICNILEISLEECAECSISESTSILPSQEYDAKKLGETIKELRIKNNLSQSAVGKALFVTSQTISRWESGGLNSFENLQAVSKFYGISMTQLLQGEIVQTAQLQDIQDVQADGGAKKSSKKNLIRAIAIVATLVVIVVLSVFAVVFLKNDNKDTDGNNEVESCSHIFVYVPEVEATCDTDGNIAYWKCKECNELFLDSNGKSPITEIVINKIGHNFGDWSVTKEADCVLEGEETRYCLNDKSHIETRKLSILPHSLEYTSDEERHSSKCSKCLQSIDVEVAHAYDQNNICAICGHIKFACIFPIYEFVFGYTFHDEPIFISSVGKYLRHPAVDFIAPHGSEVKCVFDGTVIAIEEDSYFGVKLDIQHINGYVSTYYRIADCDLKVGDKVRQGEVVGKVSGDALYELELEYYVYNNETHICYSLKKDEEEIDPLKFMG